MHHYGPEYESYLPSFLPLFTGTVGKKRCANINMHDELLLHKEDCITYVESHQRSPA